MTTEFTPWAKTPRLFRDCIITEKIDGTNSAVKFVKSINVLPGMENLVQAREGETLKFTGNDVPMLQRGDDWYAMYVQSRKRLITPKEDNYGFARWCYDNAETLLDDLGEGTHFGEYWGRGIQKRYTIDHKRFSLFRAGMYKDVTFSTPNLDVVPIVYEGPFDTEVIRDLVSWLKVSGSMVDPKCDRPEGLIVYHTAASQVFKVLCENDEIPKGLVSE